jgi:hypothetical protein
MRSARGLRSSSKRAKAHAKIHLIAQHFGEVHRVLACDPQRN